MASVSGDKGKDGADAPYIGRGMRRREDLDFANADFDPDNPVIIVYSIDRDNWTVARG